MWSCGKTCEESINVEPYQNIKYSFIFCYFHCAIILLNVWPNGMARRYCYVWVKHDSYFVISFVWLNRLYHYDKLMKMISVKYVLWFIKWWTNVHELSSALCRLMFVSCDFKHQLIQLFCLTSLPMSILMRDVYRRIPSVMDLSLWHFPDSDQVTIHKYNHSMGYSFFDSSVKSEINRCKYVIRESNASYVSCNKKHGLARGKYIKPE